MQAHKSYKFFGLVITAFLLSLSFLLNAQTEPVFGPNDTIVVPAVTYNGEKLPYKDLPMVYVSNLSEKELAKYLEDWNRLRNAVYVTYPYARIAGRTINDINVHLAGANSKKQRKEYIKTREKELRTQFTTPMENLSVYQ